MSDFNQDTPKRPPMPPYPPHFQQKSGGSKWWIPVVIVLGSIALFIITIIGVIAYITSSISEINFDSANGATLEVKDKSILYLDLSNGVPEKVEDNPFQNIFGGGEKASSFFNTLSAIERAKEDDRIEGIYLKPSGNLTYNKAIEINEALSDFKKSGKFVYAFIEVGDESTYLSALPADSIFMPTEGMLEMNGFAITNPFFKSMFDKIGVSFLTIQFEDYKSAGEQFSRDSYSDSAKFEYRLLLEDRYNAFIDEIVKYRNISKDKIQTVLNEGFYTTGPAMEHKFIDAILSEMNVKRFLHTKLAYNEDKKSSKNDDEEDEESKEDSDDYVRFVSVGKYMKSNFDFIKEEDIDKDNQIGIVYASGAISSGKKQGGPFGGGEDGIYSQSFIEDLKAAREDEDVKVVILRIDSPGGSAMASDEMWEEIRLTTKTKPVIASMSSVAASGGYYMAMACDKIIAHPQTITGSVGVILSVPNLSGTMDKIGLNWDTITTGPAADFMNGVYPYSPTDIAKLREIAGGIYQRFVSRAAESRGFEYEEMRSKAKGRVYTGAKAKEIGLVDELGGLQATIDMAKEIMGVDKNKLVYIKEFPKKGKAIEEFIENLMNNMDAKVVTNILSAFGFQQSDMAILINSMPESVKSQFKYFMDLVDISKKEKVILAVPALPEIK